MAKEDEEDDLLPDKDAAKGFYAKYEPKEILGRGISSTVRRCVEKETGKEFAAKIIDLGIGTDDNSDTNPHHMLDATRQEISILRQVMGHPYIIDLQDVFESDAFVFLVFELCPKGELFDYLTSVVTLSEKKTRTIMRQIFEGVEYIHSKNIVHRDLKPENILLDENHNVKITDFGFARQLKDGEKLTDLCGTPGYLAPETLKCNMFEGSPGYSKEVDIWACGVIMFTLLVGCPPFWHRKQMVMLRNIMEGKYSFTSPEWVDISEDPKNLIRKCLVVDPTQRITVKEVLRHPFFNQMLFEQNIDGLKRSLSTKSRRMSRITEIAMVLLTEPALDGRPTTYQLKSQTPCLRRLDYNNTANKQTKNTSSRSFNNNNNNKNNNNNNKNDNNNDNDFNTNNANLNYSLKICYNKVISPRSNFFQDQDPESHSNNKYFNKFTNSTVTTSNHNNNNNNTKNNNNLNDTSLEYSLKGLDSASNNLNSNQTYNNNNNNYNNNKTPVNEEIGARAAGASTSATVASNYDVEQKWHNITEQQHKLHLNEHQQQQITEYDPSKLLEADLYHHQKQHQQQQQQQQHNHYNDKHQHEEQLHYNYKQQYDTNEIQHQQQEYQHYPQIANHNNININKYSIPSNSTYTHDVELFYAQKGVKGDIDAIIDHLTSCYKEPPSLLRKQSRFNARKKFQYAILVVRAIIRIRRLRYTAEPLHVEDAIRDPYRVKVLRKVIDGCAFRVYGHWVKKGEGQNRAALFENTPRTELHALYINNLSR